MTSSGPSVNRRTLLSVLGATSLGTLGGCSDRLWSQVEYSPLEQISLSVKFPPTDEDPSGANLASHFVENLAAAGIDATPEPVAIPELHREVFLEGDFDVFITRHPGLDDPDVLRSLLHSQFIGEAGWQNPFAFSDVTVDGKLETQTRRDGDDRTESLADLFQHLLITTPFVAVCYPDHLGLLRSDLDRTRPVRTVLDYHDLLWSPGTADENDTYRRVGVMDPERTMQFNPLAVAGGEPSVIVDLLYDHLVRQIDGTAVEWLAKDVAWDDGDTVEASITLREEATWNDGTPVRASDVIFTVEFLADTSLGDANGKVPAPRYRGRIDLIDEATRIDEHTVRFQYDSASMEVARRSLMIPILPEGRWRERTSPVQDHLTEALVHDNETPIGSGPFELAETNADGTIVCSARESHFIEQVASDLGRQRTGTRSFDGIELTPVQTMPSAVERLETGDLVTIGNSVSPIQLQDLDVPETVDVRSDETPAFYMIGFNVRESELGNPRFREILGRLVDRTYVESVLFDGYARTSQIRSAHVGVAPDRWHTRQTVDVGEFPGSEGTIDEHRVREIFEDAGYRYDEDGSLVS